MYIMSDLVTDRNYEQILLIFAIVYEPVYFLYLFEYYLQVLLMLFGYYDIYGIPFERHPRLLIYLKSSIPDREQAS